MEQILSILLVLGILGFFVGLPAVFALRMARELLPALWRRLPLPRREPPPEVGPAALGFAEPRTDNAVVRRNRVVAERTILGFRCLLGDVEVFVARGGTASLGLQPTTVEGFAELHCPPSWSGPPFLLTRPTPGTGLDALARDLGRTVAEIHARRMVAAVDTGASQNDGPAVEAAERMAILAWALTEPEDEVVTRLARSGRDASALRADLLLTHFPARPEARDVAPKWLRATSPALRTRAALQVRDLDRLATLTADATVPPALRADALRALPVDREGLPDLLTTLLKDDAPPAVRHAAIDRALEQPADHAGPLLTRAFPWAEGHDAHRVLKALAQLGDATDTARAALERPDAPLRALALDLLAQTWSAEALGTHLVGIVEAGPGPALEGALEGLERYGTIAAVPALRALLKRRRLTRLDRDAATDAITAIQARAPGAPDGALSVVAADDESGHLSFATDLRGALSAPEGEG
ncbi:MAG: hypothetical protein H6704_15650 [Myxococcales bacterium]|nr:hypothetical protein [Myxococcales bacterium]